MATSKLQIQLTAKDKASGKIKKTEKQMGKLGKATDKARGKLQKMTGATKLLGGAMVGFSAIAAAKMLRGLFELGIEAERSMVALEAFTGSSRAAEEAIEAVADAAQGGISDLAAAQNATRLFSMGLASTAEEAAKLTKIAITLGATMGKGPQEAFEEFTLLLANQSILRLDTFGISGGQVRESMANLAKEMPNATREARFLAAVMEEAEGKMFDLEEAGFEAVSSLDKFDANLENLRVHTAELIKDGLGPTLDVMVNMADATDEVSSAFQRGLISQQQFGELMAGLRNGFLTTGEAMAFVANSAQSSLPALDDQKVALMELGGAAVSTAETLAGVAVSTRELSAASIGQAAMTDLNSALKEGLVSQEDYDLAAREVMSTLLVMPQAQIDANFQMRALSTSFKEGSITADQLVTQAQRLNLELNRLESKKITIDVDFNVASPGGGFGFQHGGSFIVGGPSGPDRSFAAFPATRGERVTVTPAGGDTNNDNRIGPINITSEIDGQALIEQLKTVVRRS